jgi:hypothetical protein
LKREKDLCLIDIVVRMLEVSVQRYTSTAGSRPNKQFELRAAGTADLETNDRLTHGLEQCLDGLQIGQWSYMHRP